MIGYKVVFIFWTEQFKKIFSCTESIAPIEYKINEWVYKKRNLGSLAVFNKFEDASHFRWSVFRFRYNDIKIYKCEYKQAKKARFLKNGYDKKNKKYCPKGTDFAYAVKLLEEIILW